jgi:two-component system, NarL family, response regulator NreC
MTAIRVFLVDDHVLFRAGLNALLATDESLCVVGEVGSGEEAVAEVERLRPDVVLMDLALPGMDGLEATRRITAQGGGTKVLVLTAHAEGEHLRAILEAGGSGYLTKDRTGREMFEAIRTVAADGVFLSPVAARLVLDSYRSPPMPVPQEEAPIQVLSAREREVLIQTAEGYTASEIAAGLEISPKTVDTYRQRVMDKLNLRRRRDLVQFALRGGLLTVHP